MDNIQKNVLQQNRIYLVDNIQNIDKIMNCLMHNDILNQYNVAHIKAKKGLDKNRELLDILLKRDEKAFDMFIEALKESDQEPAADYLLSCEAELRNKHGLPPRLHAASTESHPAVRETGGRGDRPLSRKGRALIVNINQYTCENFPNIVGPRGEFDHLTCSLETLGYSVEVKSGNISCDYVKKLIRDYTVDEDLKEVSSLIVMVKCHGGMNYVATSEGFPIPVEWFFEAFDNKNCPSLAKKLKLFIFQILTSEDEEIDKPSIKRQANEATATTQTPKADRVPTSSDQIAFYIYIPKSAMTERCPTYTICDVFKDKASANVNETLTVLKGEVDKDGRGICYYRTIAGNTFHIGIP